MKRSNLILAVLFVGLLILWIYTRRHEAFKNIDFDAVNQLEKITTKILPGKAICIRGAQCISGKCLENNNETTYGYCADPL